MQNVIYKRKGVKVVLTGAVRIVLPSGLILPETYSIDAVNDAIEYADELAEREQVLQIAA